MRSLDFARDDGGILGSTVQWFRGSRLRVASLLIQVNRKQEAAGALRRTQGRPSALHNSFLFSASPPESRPIMLEMTMVSLEDKAFLGGLE